jgi:hypothetical protein
MQFESSETEEIVPLGLRADGSPFWAYVGAEGEGTGTGTDGDGESEDEEDENDDDDGLTPGGKKAIEAERAAAKAARDALRPWRMLAKELGLKSPDEVRAALQATKNDQSKSDQRSQQDQVDVRRVQQEITEKANKRIINAEIRALAAERFADPRDAVKFLDAGEYDVDEDGEVDSRSIERDLSELLREKPHLAKVSRRVDFEGGARGGTSGKPLSMNEIIRNAAGRGRR